MSWPVWEEAERCTAGPEPGAEALMKAIMDIYDDRGAYNLGIYNCRTVRGASTTSVHGEGRALDVGFPVGDPDGNDLLRRLLKVPGRLGMQAVIYERRIYSKLSPGGRDYDGLVPHTDHLHIELTRESGNHLTYTTAKQCLHREHRRPGSRSLRVGCRGYDVRWLQNHFNIPSDGIYGPGTRDRVKRFEARRAKAQPGLYGDLHVDGNVGSLTWRALGVRPAF